MNVALNEDDLVRLVSEKLATSDSFRTKVAQILGSTLRTSGTNLDELVAKEMARLYTVNNSWAQERVTKLVHAELERQVGREVKALVGAALGSSLAVAVAKVSEALAAQVIATLQPPTEAVAPPAPGPIVPKMA